MTDLFQYNQHHIAHEPHRIIHTWLTLLTLSRSTQGKTSVRDLARVRTLKNVVETQGSYFCFKHFQILRSKDMTVIRPLLSQISFPIIHQLIWASRYLTVTWPWPLTWTVAFKYRSITQSIRVEPTFHYQATKLCCWTISRANSPPLYTLKLSSPKIHFNIIFSSKLMSPKWSLPLKVYGRNIYSLSSASGVYYMSRLSNFFLS
jgi:hypothetical protein